MALALFRSYVLLIVLYMFITLIDKSQQVVIPPGCQVVFAENNKIVFPKDFKVNPPKENDGGLPSNWLQQTTDGPIVELSKGFSVTVPEGFEVILPNAMKDVPTGFFNFLKGECKCNLFEGVKVTPTQGLKDAMKATDYRIKRYIDFFRYDENDVKWLGIGLQATFPRCIVTFKNDNKIILLDNSEIIIPALYNGVLPLKWLTQSQEGPMVNLPTGSSVLLPEGFRIISRKGFNALPPKDWLVNTVDGKISVQIPPGWKVEPTDDLKNKNTEVSIKLWINKAKNV